MVLWSFCNFEVPGKISMEEREHVFTNQYFIWARYEYFYQRMTSPGFTRN